jgi:hypothetical protein
MLCTHPNHAGCYERITSRMDLAAPANQRSDLYMWSPGGDTTSAYKSLNPVCTKNYYDCNTGPASTMYAHMVPEGGYLYIDYWIFYRFNDAPLQGVYFDEHQGDWEGLTVAVRKNDPSGGVAYVLYRQHSGAPGPTCISRCAAGPSGTPARPEASDRTRSPPLEPMPIMCGRVRRLSRLSARRRIRIRPTLVATGAGRGAITSRRATSSFLTPAMSGCHWHPGAVGCRRPR